MKFCPRLSPMFVAATLTVGLAACADPAAPAGETGTQTPTGFSAAKADGVGGCEPAGPSQDGPTLARQYAGPEGSTLTIQDGYAALRLADGTTVEGNLQRDGTLGASYTVEVAEGMVCGTFRLSLWASEGVVGDGSHLELSWIRPEGSVANQCGFMVAGEGGYDRVVNPTLAGTYQGPEGSALTIEAGNATVRLPDGDIVEGPLSRDGTLGGSYTVDVAEGSVCGTYRISLWAAEGTLGDGSRVSLTWLVPQGSVAADCAFMRAAEGAFVRSGCEADEVDQSPMDSPEDDAIASGFTHTRLDPATGLMLGAHPEKFVVQWNDGAGVEGTVYRTTDFASGEPEAESCGRVTRSQEDLWFEGGCGLAARFGRSGDQDAVVYALDQRIDFSEAGFTSTDVDPATGAMQGAHPQKFAVAWTDETLTEGEVYFTRNFATGEPEDTPCGTVRIDGDDATFDGQCGLSDLYIRNAADPTAPFEAHERIYL